MSLSDAYVRIMCDTCGQEEEISLPFVYPDLSGRNGSYDRTDLKLPEGWSSHGPDIHSCPTCLKK